MCPIMLQSLQMFHAIRSNRFGATPMPTTTDAPPNRPHPDPAQTAARIGELLRLHLFLDQPGLDLAAVRSYGADRLRAPEVTRTIQVGSSHRS
jgi:hypothetical protein